MSAGYLKVSMETLVNPESPVHAPLVRQEGSHRVIQKGRSKECFYFQVARKLIGDKWSLLVLFILRAGPMRFNALCRGVEGISQKVLAATLKDLERDGYLARQVLATTPPSVTYSLTGMGEEFLGVLANVSAWVEDHWQQMEHSRKLFDSEAVNSLEAQAR